MLKLVSLESLSRRLLYLLVVLVPLIFWPGTFLGLETIKTYVLLILVLVVAAVYLATGWQSGTLKRISSWWLVALWVLPLAALFSSLSSGAILHSLIGSGLETDTFFALAIFALLATLVPFVLSTRRDLSNVLMLLLGVGLINNLFQLLRLIGNFTFLNIFDPTAANLIGKWNELGIFAGLTLLISLAFISLLPWRRTKFLAGLVITAGITSFLVLLLVNYNLAWLLTSIGALAILAGQLIFGQLSPRRLFRFINPATIVLVISLFFFWFGQVGNTPAPLNAKFDLGTFINNVTGRLGVQVLEVYPSWPSTWMIAKSSLANNPVFGIGPNKFAAEWFKTRPVDVNETLFWQDSFKVGAGLVPSAVATLGVVGILSYALLILSVFGSGLLIWRQRSRELIDSILIFIIWLLTIYLWIFSIVYIPGIVILTLTFFFTGLLISALSVGREGLEYNSVSQTRLGKIVATFGQSGGLVVVFILLALVGQSFWSNVTYNRGLLASFSGDLIKGERLIARAASLNPSDIFYRSLVDLDLAFMSQIAAATDLKPEEVQQRFQAALSAAIANAQKARDYNSTNYLNWLYLGRVYESVVPLKVPNTYEEALKAYTKAKELAPSMPSVLLAFARLEIAAGNTAAARDYLDQALKVKRDYTEAIFIWAQIDSASGNLNRAIALADQAAKISPNNPVTFFSLGLLNYQAGNYTRARDALEQAVLLNPNYANARYFLGLSYDALGANARALEQFKILLPANNTPEINQIITNLEAGRRALANTTPPAPEDREALPVKETEE